MSTFYGMLQGNRGAVTRGGSRSSGIKASTQSWDGSVITELSYENDKLMVTISTATGSSSYGSRIFHGTFEEYIIKLQK